MLCGSAKWVAGAQALGHPPLPSQRDYQGAASEELLGLDPVL